MAKIVSSPWSKPTPRIVVEEPQTVPPRDNSVYSPICPRTNKIHRWAIDDGEIFCKDCFEPRPKRKT